MESLMFLLVFLFFMTLFGHGIWELVAFCIRSITGTQTKQPRDIRVELQQLLQENLIDVVTHRKVMRALERRANSFRFEVEQPVAAGTGPSQLPGWDTLLPGPTGLSAGHALQYLQDVAPRNQPARVP